MGDVDRREIVDCDSGLPIEGFGFKVCSKETDIYAATDADFTIDYQVGIQRYSCDIINQPKAANVLYTCKSAIPIGECYEEEDDFVQISMKGTNDVCVDAIIYDGKMLPTEPIRLGDDVHASPFFVDHPFAIYMQEVFKRRYNVRNGKVLRMSLPTGYESLELIAPQCFTMRVEVTACEWHDKAVGGDLMMRTSGSEGKGNYFSVNEAAQLPISGETKEYFFTSAVYDGIGKLNGVDLHVEDDDGYCISNVEVDTIDGLQSMDFDANHFGNGIFIQTESLELQHNSRRRMLESEGEEKEPNSLRIVTIGSLVAVVLCMMVILYYARVTSAHKKMILLDDGNSIQLQV